MKNLFYYFETLITNKPLTHWSDLLHTHFGNSFHYHIVRIMKDSNNRASYIEYKRKDLFQNFTNKVKDYLLKKNS
jgi:hypothetical protein